MSQVFHFYQPSQGHRLPHDPFKAIIGPRPIGWISSCDREGRTNLAPYSYFNAFCDAPPIIGFASNGRKDSLQNIEQTGEFVWNLVTRPLAEAMNLSSLAVAPEVDEFELAGLERAPSRLVSPPRVAASPVAFECRCTQILQLKNLQGEALQSWLVLGEVIGVHIDSAYLREGIYDTASAAHVLRGGGIKDYFMIGAEQLFRMNRPRQS